MRKHIWLLLILLLFPVSVFAKCDVISGTGYEAGDKVICGGKEFHVFSFDGSTLRLLSDNYITYGMKLDGYIINSKTYNNLRDISIDDNRYDRALRKYKEYLYNNGVETKKIDILSMKDINEFVKENGGGYLPSNFNGNLLEFIDIRYDFLWRLKINLKTVVDANKITNGLILENGKVQEQSLEEKFYFRPVIDVDVREIEFRVDVITRGDGNVEMNQEIFLPGEVVTYDAIAREGYKVTRVLVMDSQGIEVETTDNRFIMPKSDVRIKAFFEPESSEEKNIELTTSINNQIMDNTKYLIMMGVLVLVVSVLGVDMLILHKE